VQWLSRRQPHGGECLRSAFDHQCKEPGRLPERVASPQLRPATSALERGALVASASADATVRLWRASCWSCLRIFALPPPGAPPLSAPAPPSALQPYPFLSVAMTSRCAAQAPCRQDEFCFPLQQCCGVCAHSGALEVALSTADGSKRLWGMGTVCVTTHYALPQDTAGLALNSETEDLHLTAEVACVAEESHYSVMCCAQIHRHRLGGRHRAPVGQQRPVRRQRA
jgi:hypothetical protein